MLEPNKPYQKAMIQPLPDMIIGISSKYPSLSLVSLLDAISESGTGIKEDADKSHFQLQVSFSEDQMCIAYLVDRYPSLTLREKLVLSTAPVPIKNSETELAHAFEHYLTYLNSRKTVPPYLNSLDSRTSSEALRNLETRFKITDLYLWLANRFPEYFVAVNDVLSMREDCTAKIDAILR